MVSEDKDETKKEENKWQKIREGLKLGAVIK